MTRATIIRVLVGGFLAPDDWLPRVLDLDPYPVALRHDLATWQQDA